MVKVNKSTNLVHKFGEFCKKEKAQMIRKWSSSKTDFLSLYLKTSNYLIGLGLLS